ncbi:scamp-domain-containing protein [Meredithblackwellia eburnea MCA 4105]
MSANPFADPHSMDSNPFEDPSVQQARESSRHEYGYGAETPTNNESYPQQQQASASNRSDEMAQRFDDLERREQELKAREAALAAKAEHIRKHGRNNWPPGPFPILFHDIEQEIPEQHKSTVLTWYRIWMFLVLVLAVNLVGGVLLLISGANNGGADLGAAIMYLPVIGVLSFFTWYQPVYKAYQTGYAVFFYIFFLFAGFHLAFCTYMFIGIPSSGSAGLINLISRFAGGHIVAGVFCILSTAGWALEGLAALWMYKNVWAHTHGQAGLTFAQAKQEVSMYGLKAYLFNKSSLPAQSAA